MGGRLWVQKLKKKTGSIKSKNVFFVSEYKPTLTPALSEGGKAAW
jgi:hypothetical protein